jgi:type II secretory pathway pseudopilin PulG
MKSDHKSGMTLVEVIVSLLLAGITFASIAAAFSAGLAALRASRETEFAVQASQREMEKMRNTAFTGILGHSFDVFHPNDHKGTVVVQTESTAPGNGLKKVSINVSWTSGARSRSIQLLTRMTEKGINRK